MHELLVEELLELVQSGDESAATELFHRYVDRLIHLARSRLTPSLERRVDAEDVVQSACRSFFRRVVDGRYRAVEEDQLWHLLAAITVNKARKAVRKHTTQKRSIIREQITPTFLVPHVSTEAVARDPSPEEAAILIEETKHMMAGLTPLQRHIVQLQLQGHTAAEIAQEVSCSRRTVRRSIEQARVELETILGIAVRD